MTLLTRSESPDRQTLYWNYPHYHRGSGMKPACSIRDGRFKLIRWYEPEILNGTKRLELYDLYSDPGEQFNLADSFPERAGLLSEQLDQWIRVVGAQIPVINEKGAVGAN